MAQETTLSGPDLKAGIAESELAEGGMLLGHAAGEAVLLARRGAEIFGIGATCSHYGGPLAEGILAEDTVRCPWHHACFSLRTGEALAAPAFSPVACWRVERSGGRIYVRDKLEATERVLPPVERQALPAGARFLIIGGGAAGVAAAEMLAREGCAGRTTLISADADPPYDRPNLSKDYLAGTAPEEWIPLRPPEFYAENGIALVLGAEVRAIDTAAKRVSLADGRTYDYDRLLIATGAEPVRLEIPGAGLPHVRTLRSLADSRALIERAKAARHAVVIGASFIGLEVAAALRHRGIEVDVVAPEHRPLERVLGPELGDFIRGLHEKHGVRFHLGRTVGTIAANRVTLDDGTTLEADLVVVGIGVRPRLALAEAAGLAVDRGILVDEHLETSVNGIFAAGDIARWPDPYSGERLRIEHWVVAERQGQVAARNMLGRGERYTAPPFFWSQHYDVAIDCVGHAAGWETVEIDGDIERCDVLLRYRKAKRTRAVVSIFRGRDSLEAELAMERGRSP